MLSAKSASIAITVVPQAKGRYLCELALMQEGQRRAGKSFHGQSPNHAIAIALEDLARDFRLEAEAEQNIDWEAVDRAPSGEPIEKRFHVVLHYERVASEESKFEAMHNTVLGNTVIENAELTIIQVDPEMPIEPWKRRRRKS